MKTSTCLVCWGSSAVVHSSAGPSVKNYTFAVLALCNTRRKVLVDFYRCCLCRTGLEPNSLMCRCMDILSVCNDC